jgi:hypothetical protein
MYAPTTESTAQRGLLPAKTQTSTVCNIVAKRARWRRACVADPHRPCCVNASVVQKCWCRYPAAVVWNALRDWQSDCCAMSGLQLVKTVPNSASARAPCALISRLESVSGVLVYCCTVENRVRTTCDNLTDTRAHTGRSAGQITERSSIPFVRRGRHSWS